MERILQETNQMGENQVRYIMKEEVLLDHIALSVVTNDKPYFLADYTVKERNGELEFIYNVTDYISLEYLRSNFEVKSYVDFWLQLINPLVECADWCMEVSQICLDIRHIYYEKQSGRILYLFIPEQAHNPYIEELRRLIAQLLKQCKLTQTHELSIALYECLHEDNFHPNKFKLILDKYVADTGSNHNEAKEVVPIMNQPKQQVQQEIPVTEDVVEAQVSNPMSNQVQERPEIQRSSNDSVEDMMKQALYNQSKGKKSSFSLFSKKNKEKESKKVPKNEVVVPQVETVKPVEVQRNAIYVAPVQEEIEDEVTELFIDASMNVEHKVYLELVGNVVCDKTIALDLSHQQFTLGRRDKTGNRPSSYEFPDTVRAISRQHACFVQRGETINLVDLKSANGTYVNGNKIDANLEVVVIDGDVIGFSKSGYDYKLHTM